MTRLLLVSVLAIALPCAVNAQVAEVELGGGYVVGGGVENPGPSLPAYDVGFALWPAPRWGVAVRRVEGLGEDLYETPIPGGDRTWLGQAKLRYWTIAARHRRPVSRSLGVEIGMGLMVAGHFGSVVVFNDPILGRRSQPDNFFGGLSFDGLLTRDLWKHVTLKGGATYDFNVETNNFHPIVLVAVGL